MPEEINGKKIFTLLEVARSIQKTIAERYKSTYWIKAEMNKLNYFPKSGHCYPDLVEKQNGKVVAEFRCNLWKDDYIKINSTFQRVLKEPLKDGIKILFLASISFHPEHGLALRIIDIDPSFTLGDIEKEKQETIKRLQDEGIFRQNKSLKLPLLTQRIAIISVNTSKGYQDFLGKIDNNSWGYKFFHMLFPSILQGDKIVEQMTAQLNRINKVKSHFDAVAIIRGGGGDVGLSSFNKYEFAKAIALFPLPILSGIGHITNDTVVEMVSHKSFITPTDLANFLFQEFHNFSVPVQKGQEKIVDKSKRLIKDEKTKFQSEVKLFRSVTSNVLSQNRSAIREQAQTLTQQSRFLFRNQKDSLASFSQQIQSGTRTFCNGAKQTLIQFATGMKKDAIAQLRQVNLLITQHVQQILIGTKAIVRSQNVELSNTERNIQNMSPRNVMKRGYSITFLNGKAVKSFEQVKPGDVLNSQIYEGAIMSIVKSTNKPNEQ